MGKAIFGAVLVTLTAGLLAAACGGGEEEESNQSPTATTVVRSTAPAQSPTATTVVRSTAPPQATSAPAGALTVTQVNFRFQPDNLAGQAGQAVTVDVENDGSVPHTFTITELNVDETLQPGDKATVTFTPSNGGTLAYFCRFHRSSGMEGTLTVTGGSGGANPQSTTSTPNAGLPGFGY